MSVIIKGMAMPETCYECKFCDHQSEYPFRPFCVAHLNCIEDPRSGRLDTCPLVEIPRNHGDLLNKDELSRLVGESFDYFLARLGLKCPKPIIPVDKTEEECENENWYTELDDPKFGEWSEDGQT